MLSFFQARGRSKRVTLGRSTSEHETAEHFSAAAYILGDRCDTGAASPRRRAGCESVCAEVRVAWASWMQVRVAGRAAGALRQPDGGARCELQFVEGYRWRGQQKRGLLCCGGTHALACVCAFAGRALAVEVLGQATVARLERAMQVRGAALCLGAAASVLEPYPSRRVHAATICARGQGLPAARRQRIRKRRRAAEEEAHSGREEGEEEDEEEGKGQDGDGDEEEVGEGEEEEEEGVDWEVQVDLGAADEAAPQALDASGEKPAPDQEHQTQQRCGNAAFLFCESGAGRAPPDVRRSFVPLRMCRAL